MKERMINIVVTKFYRHDFRPKLGVSVELKPSTTPQIVGEIVARAAIKAGCAREVDDETTKPPSKKRKPVDGD